ncbi:cyclase family protein [Antrihabitans sp. YC2-6]|uniref:cyclase family protein n=1 Tax=Antrihabitans sp. YC2-6 TaxID=2799498 RepID=UPI0018F74E9F|nr:cyclase family protein [Antrihabitans sp. YC2-6]MBJ8347146.1 cyclase family protein [Antrihabitans sp. YC2-6]
MNEPTDVAFRLSRRSLFAGAAALAMTGCVSDTTEPAVASPSTPTSPTIEIENDTDLERALPSLSNWGRWGQDDELGTLNYMTPQTRLAATALIRTGRVVPFAREISSTTPNLRDLTYKIKRYDDPLPEESGCIDEIGMTYHGFAVTHVDALCHIFTPEGKQGMYNGFSVDEVTPSGAQRLGIERIGEVGIVGRGVLLDVAEARGGPLQVGSVIRPEDLESAERLHQVQVGEADIVFVRNGGGVDNTYQRGTGLHASCLPWLRERRVSVLSSDSDSDVHPPLAGFERWTEPMHMVLIPYFGMPILDNTDLDALAEACAAEQRWTFFVSVSPWRFKGATSSPVNPMAIF